MIKDTVERESRLWNTLLVPFGLLLATGLLVGTSLTRSVWIDELYSIRIAGEPSVAQVVRNVIQLERRPPLYHVLLHYWIALFGAGDLTMRLLSIAVAVLGLALVYWIARDLADSQVGILTLFLTGCSPLFVLYAPMIRYYSLTVFLGLLSTAFFLKLRRTSTPALWAGYIVGTGLLVYTDYAALSLLLVQSAFVWLCPNRHKIPPWRWLLVQAGMALLLGTWATAVFRQIGRAGTQADLATGPVGYVAKAASSVYSFGLGGTLFPWTWAGIAGVLVTSALLVAGAVFWLKRRDWFVLAMVLVPLGFTSLIISYVAVDITFLNVPSRTLFALPFYLMLLAGGLRLMRNPRLRLLALLLLALVWGDSLVNLAEGRQYLNPVYAVPTREAVAWVTAQVRPGDVIFSDPDVGFEYYYARGPQPVPSLSLADATAALTYVDDRRPRRVWLLTLGRDSTGEYVSAALRQRLTEDYTLTQEQGYAEQDATYRQIKERLLHRPAYRYKLLVQCYERLSP